MRFGIQLPTYGATASPDAIAGAARRAEALGFNSVWTNDHVLVPARLTNPYGRIFEAVTTLAWVAACTERVRVGVSVLIIPQRDPVLAAKQLATVDVLSGGRLIVGVAAGYVPEEFDYLRASFAQRGRLLEEYVAVMRALWRGESSFSGEWIEFDDAVFGPRPIQGDAVPLWLGGTSNAALRRAAALADAWHPAAIDAETLAEKGAMLREAAGDRPVKLTLKIRTRFSGIAGDERQRASSTDFPEAVELAGTTEEIRDRLVGYREAGLDELVTFFFHRDEAELATAMESFAADVMPALAA